MGWGGAGFLLTAEMAACSVPATGLAYTTAPLRVAASSARVVLSFIKLI
jgi:hypothetical protein